MFEDIVLIDLILGCGWVKLMGKFRRGCGGGLEVWGVWNKKEYIGNGWCLDMIGDNGKDWFWR